MVLAPMPGAKRVPWFLEPWAPPAPSRETVVQLHRLYVDGFVFRIAPGPVVMQNSDWLPPPGPPIAVFQMPVRARWLRKEIARLLPAGGLGHPDCGSLPD